MSTDRFSIVLTSGEIDLLTQGLNTRAAFIETGTPHLRAFDAEHAGEKVNALSVDQMRCIVASDDLATRLNKLKEGDATW